MAAAEREEARLQFAPRLIRLKGLAYRQVEIFSLTQRGRELLLGKEAAEVGERARRRRDGDVQPAGDVLLIERPGSMDDDAAAPAAARLGRNRDMRINVNTGWGRGATKAEHSPKLASTRVAQHRPVTTSEHCRHPSPGLAQALMPNGEDAAMNTVKAAGLHSSQPAALSHTYALKLADGDHTVLSSREASDRRIRIAIGALPTHVGG